MILYDCNDICNTGHQSYHQDFAKQNATVPHHNCRFSFKQMCKIGQIICMIENYSPDLHSVNNDV